MESDEVMTKCSKSYTSLDDVSCGFSGLFSLTDPVRIEAVHWRDNGCFWGCVQCRRKVDTKCSLHPDSGSKVYYRLRVLIRQGDVLLWLTAFDEIATIIVGTPASEYGSLDVLGLRAGTRVVERKGSSALNRHNRLGRWLSNGSPGKLLRMDAQSAIRLMVVRRG